MWQGTRDLNHLDLLYPAAVSCSLSTLPAVLADSQLTLPSPSLRCLSLPAQTSTSQPLSLGSGQEDRDVSSLGLAADSCLFQLSTFIFETLSESE